MPESLVWMANRDQPVNGRNSRLSLSKDGDLFLSDAGGIIPWTTKTRGQQVQEAVLLNTGNIILRSSSGNILWQNFDSPTNTLLSDQLFTKDTQRVRRLNRGSYKSGYYHFYFNDDNFLRLIYRGSEIYSEYWPCSWKKALTNGRTTYNIPCRAGLNRSSGFSSSELFSFEALDYAEGRITKIPS